MCYLLVIVYFCGNVIGVAGEKKTPFQNVEGILTHNAVRLWRWK
jgi:hypothetical protein